MPISPRGWGANKIKEFKDVYWGTLKCFFTSFWCKTISSNASSFDKEDFLPGEALSGWDMSPRDPYSVKQVRCGYYPSAKEKVESWIK